MPVTARLSQLFYERLGVPISNELVDWFNAVDATYRSDLREINELNFARFDAKLEQRVAGLDAKIEQRVAQLEAKIEQRVAQLGARIDKLETKLDTKLEAAVAQHAFAQLDAKIETTTAGVRIVLEKGLRKQLRWMFSALAALLIPIIGLWMRR